MYLSYVAAVTCKFSCPMACIENLNELLLALFFPGRMWYGIKLLVGSLTFSIAQESFMLKTCRRVKEQNTLNTLLHILAFQLKRSPIRSTFCCSHKLTN